MVDEISPRSGVLDCEQGGATFYEENYKFRIMNNVPFKATSSRTEDYSKLAQSNKYFHGTTHDGSDIAVYCGSRTMPPIRTVAIFLLMFMQFKKEILKLVIGKNRCD